MQGALPRRVAETRLAETRGGTATAGGLTTPSVSGWRVTIDVTQLNQLPGRCFVSGVTPPRNHDAPNTAEQEWAFVDGTPEHVLLFQPYSGFNPGDAPTLHFEAIAERPADQGREWNGTLETIRVGPPGRKATEVRSTAMGVKLVFTGERATGSLSLKSAYRCIDGADRCPSPHETPGRATGSCELTLPVTATRLSTLPAWLQPSDPTPGSTRFVFVTAPRMAPDACFTSGQAPFSVRADGARSFTGIERMGGPQGPSLRLPSLPLSLGDAPSLPLAGPLVADANGTFAATSTVTSSGPTGRSSMERRTVTMAMPFEPIDGLVTTTLEARSTYTCTDSGPAPSQRCPVGNEPKAPDAIDCSLPIRAFAVQLP